MPLDGMWCLISSVPCLGRPLRGPLYIRPVWSAESCTYVSWSNVRHSRFLQVLFCFACRESILPSPCSSFSLS
jgi:hypothetical protein